MSEITGPIMSIDDGKIAKNYLLVMALDDKPVNILLGNRQYIGTREQLYDLMGSVLKHYGFTEIMVPKGDVCIKYL